FSSTSNANKPQSILPNSSLSSSSQLLPSSTTITGNVHQQQQISITQNNIDNIKQQTPPPNATLTSTINTR
ncbi:unnamed protein product, partial [Rotaria sp. Silwood2]